MSTNKTILITGKNSSDSFSVKKGERIRLGANDVEFSHQETMTNLSLDDDVLMKAIERKIMGYKYQDNKKILHNHATIISLQEVKQKLLVCELKCIYCSKNVKVIYRVVRDPLQWTLDRIDNKKNHSNDNTVISCLNCNLKRRNINKDKFEFSQNMIIVKSN